MMYGYYGNPGYMMGGGSWLMMCGVGFFFVVLIAVGVAAVFWAISQGGGTSTTGGTTKTPTETPLEVLKRRYANGEITKKQFDEMKKDLM